MSGHAIMRMEKHSGGAGGIEAHHERKKEEYKSNPDINRDKSPYNIHLIEAQGRYNQEIKQRIEGARTRNPAIRIRENSVRFIDTLVAATPSFFDLMPREGVERYFTAALNFFKERVREDNIVSAVVHMDEATPHMHLVFVPITDDDR